VKTYQGLDVLALADEIVTFWSADQGCTSHPPITTLREAAEHYRDVIEDVVKDEPTEAGWRKLRALEDLLDYVPHSSHHETYEEFLEHLEGRYRSS
jgi:hypothetical protein